MAKTMEQLCQSKPTRCLKIPLRSTEQIYLIFLVPIIFDCTVYVINFSADLVVAIQHFRYGNPLWGISTITLMYVPAIVYFALTVSRPDWWMTEDEKIMNGAIAWFAGQVLQLLAFPLFVLYRYASLVVLTVDASILKGEERIKTLSLAAAPSAVELYLFLQAWFQAAPQAVLQTHLMFREYVLERTHQTVIVHALCIVMSIVVMSVRTASFQRFESQRINGRKLPWAMWLKKYAEHETGSEEKTIRQRVETSCAAPLIDTEQTLPKDENDQTRVNLERRISIAPPLPPKNVTDENDQTGNAQTRVNLERRISITPPLPPKNLGAKPPPTPIRGLTTVAPLPVPEMPAPPRPDSIARDPRISDDARPVVKIDAAITSESSIKWRNLRIPKRKYSVKGLDEDDPIGKLVAFVWWFFFITARVLALSIFYEFYPFWLLGIVGVHYASMIAYIFYHANHYDVTNFFLNLWLGFVYVFSVIEYRVKFKHADIWLATYYTFVILQNSLMTVTWFVYGEWTGFWYTYAFFAIFVCTALCVMSAGVYNLLLKPKKRRIYAS